MKGHSLDIETVEERLTDIMQKNGSTGHQIRDAGIKWINVIIRTGGDIHQLALAGFCILTVTYGRHSPMLRGHQLDGIGIRESYCITRHRTDAMRALGIIGRYVYDGFSYLLEHDAGFCYRRPYPPHDSQQ
jgi:hypothetical protein